MQKREPENAFEGCVCSMLIGPDAAERIGFRVIFPRWLKMQANLTLTGSNLTLKLCVTCAHVGARIVV